MGDIGGDCRYWPVSSWKLFMFGFRYLLQDMQVANEYIHNLDVHSLVLTCIQLLVEVVSGQFPDRAEVLEKAWLKYWEDALRFWKQLYACFKSRGGDWNALKCAFTQQQVVEATGRNLKALRNALSACATASEEEASISALFRTLSRMLDGEVVEWSELARLLNSTERSDAAPKEAAKPVVPARKFGHHRTRTIDQAMTRDVPDLGAARLRAEALLGARSQSASPPPPAGRLSHVKVGSGDATLGSPSSGGATIRGGPGDECRLLNFGGPHVQSTNSMRVGPLRKVTEEAGDLMKYVQD